MHPPPQRNPSPEPSVVNFLLAPMLEHLVVFLDAMHHEIIVYHWEGFRHASLWKSDARCLGMPVASRVVRSQSAELVWKSSSRRFCEEGIVKRCKHEHTHREPRGAGIDSKVRVFPSRVIVGLGFVV